MTESKISKELKKIVTCAKDDDQIVYMAQLGIKIPEYLDSTRTEIWSDPVIIPESVHTTILQLLKNCSKKEGKNV